MRDRQRDALTVFLTVDTELWPFTKDWRETCLSREMDRDIHGITSDGNFGLEFQLDLLNAHGLKGVFFVEALFPCVAGLNPLKEIVGSVRDRGHEVQLHIHTEWLRESAPWVMGGRTGRNLKDFTIEDQENIIALGARNLKECGVQEIQAFRAGNFGANFDTLGALKRNRISCDTSYSVSYLGSSCGMRMPHLLQQPTRIDGVNEFPVSFFRDYPGHHRHAQLGACSSWELENALNQAWENGWRAFVIVSHSFELVDRRPHRGMPARADRVAIERFRRLCRHLADNPDKYRTATFSGIDPGELSRGCESVSFRPLVSNGFRTALRYAEQVGRRWLP